MRTSQSGTLGTAQTPRAPGPRVRQPHMTAGGLPVVPGALPLVLSVFRPSKSPPPHPQLGRTRRPGLFLSRGRAWPFPICKGTLLSVRREQMIIECACGRLETRHDTSSHRVRGLCQRCRVVKLARIQFLLSRYYPVFAPILRHIGKGKLARVAKR